MKTIVLTGGGTAGHIMPNVALIPELKKHFDRIVYIGSKNGMEKDIIKKFSDIEFIEIETVKLIRKFTFKNLLIPIKLFKSINSCKKILKQIKPDIIFSKGGYVAVPVCSAGKSLGIKIISHESDFSFGLANKLILKKCNQRFWSAKIKCLHLDEVQFASLSIKTLAILKYLYYNVEKSALEGIFNGYF